MLELSSISNIRLGRVRISLGLFKLDYVRIGYCIRFYNAVVRLD